VLTLQEVVDEYTGRKRTIYENALNSIYVKPLNRKDSYSVVFVKVEKGKPGKAPRVIQPRSPRYNLYLAKYIKACEKRIYHAIAQVYGDGPTVMKGYNMDQVGKIIAAKWNSFTKPVCVLADAVKFDMHVHAHMLEYEHSYYNILFKHNPELMKLLTWQINNAGHAYCDDGKLKYKVKGRRFSGDMNTALGNCIIMCAMIWTYAKQRGVDVKLANNGDDCAIFMEENDLLKFTSGLSEWFIPKGFRMTIEPPCHQLEHVEFCQMHPVYNGKHYTMVRNIHTSLAKDTMTVLPVNNEGSARTWFKAVGQCGLSLTSGIPVMQEFYSMYDRQSTQSSKVLESTAMQSGMLMLSKGMTHCYAEPTPQARLSFYIAFDITPDEQRAYEDKFRNYVIDYDAITPVDSKFIPHFSITKHDL
jgi:hypothetical protein